LKEKPIKAYIPKEKKKFYRKCRFDKGSWNSEKAFYLWKKEYNKFK